MDDLVEWLRQQLDEDERVANGAAGPYPNWSASGGGVGQEGASGYLATGPWDAGLDDEVAEHIARWDPARVLREVEAKRRIMSIHRRPAQDEWNTGPFEDRCDGCGSSGEFNDPNVRDINDCPELRAIAAVYSDRPGYREEWRP